MIPVAGIRTICQKCGCRWAFKVRLPAMKVKGVQLPEMTGVNCLHCKEVESGVQD